jgi:hypothetical protein
VLKHGRVVPHPGVVGCTKPIDLGTGNMFYQVRDYAAAGQNPLAFTRYYNSMAVPDSRRFRRM